MRKKMLMDVLSVIAILALVVSPAGAITDGELDGEGHPYVGLMVAQGAGGEFLWRCSGTLLSPTLFLTAGHCTEAPAAHVEIWFDADVESFIPGKPYPFTGDVGGPHIPIRCMTPTPFSSTTWALWCWTSQWSCLSTVPCPCRINWTIWLGDRVDYVVPDPNALIDSGDALADRTQNTEMVLINSFDLADGDDLDAIAVPGVASLELLLKLVDRVSFVDVRD